MHEITEVPLQLRSFLHDQQKPILLKLPKPTLFINPLVLVTSSSLSRYALSQGHSLLTSSYAMQYNTGTYQYRLCLAEPAAAEVMPGDADGDCQTGLTNLSFKFENPRRVGL